MAVHVTTCRGRGHIVSAALQTEQLVDIDIVYMTTLVLIIMCNHHYKVLRVYDSTTRGNMFKLNKGRAKYDLRKFYFTNRVHG